MCSNNCNAQFPADLVTFTEEILNEKLHFCAVLQHLYDEDVGLKRFIKTLISFQILSKRYCGRGVARNPGEDKINR